MNDRIVDVEFEVRKKEEDEDGAAMGCLLVILFLVVDLICIGVGIVQWGFGGLFIGLGGGAVVWFVLVAVPMYLWDSRRSRRN